MHVELDGWEGINATLDIFRFIEQGTWKYTSSTFSQQLAFE